MAENTDVLDLNKPDAKLPDTETTPVMEPMISVDVSDRLLREIKRRIFPNEADAILLSSQVGEMFWKSQLWSLMCQTWPRLVTNLGKLKRAVSSMEYVVTPFTGKDELPTSSAIDKAEFVESALFGMHGDIAAQEHDFKETLEDLCDAIISGLFVAEIYWENRKGLGIVPRCTRWIPSRYIRWPYVLNQKDELLLNPSGMLGGTQLFPFPAYKFLKCIKQTHSEHPVYSAPMDCLIPWWLASRFGLEWFMTFAQLYGIPRRVGFYQPGDAMVVAQLKQMMTQFATATWGIFPKGTEIQDQVAAGAAGGHMPQERLIDEADKVCDIMILGQTLTTEVRETGGARALGQTHRVVMDEILEGTARYVAKQFTNQVIPGIVEYNYGNQDELPVLEPVIKSPKDLLQLAQSFNVLFNQMRIPVRKDELYDRIEFTMPDDDSELYEPPPAPAPVAPFGGGRPSIEGAPEDEGVAAPGRAAPGGRSIEPTNGEKPDVVERVGAQHGRRDDRLDAINGEGLLDDPNNDVDPDDGPLPVSAGARKVSFALDYGEEPEPGEVLRFVEARHDRRHPETGRFVPMPKPAKRKVGTKAKGPTTPVVGLMLKHSQTMEDNKVCQACKDICEEGWIPVDEEYLGYSMNPPHHPNCRCSNEYKTQFRGVDIHHATKFGNPRHHPKTGRFVSK
jgi:phage gp29-like protein